MNNNFELAVHHFNRSLTIFEAAEDVYHTGLANLLIGENLPIGKRRRAIETSDQRRRHFSQAWRASRSSSARTRKSDEFKNRRADGRGTRDRASNSAASQLLMVRLAEATASRELLFRELVAVLQQESQAKKIIIAEAERSKRSFGRSSRMAIRRRRVREIVGKLEEALPKGGEKVFARNRNLAILPSEDAQCETCVTSYPAAHECRF